MKKTLVSLALALAASMAMAADVGVSAVRDTNQHKFGIRATLNVPVAGLAVTPQVSVTHIGGEYDRYGFGADYTLATIGKVSVVGNAALVYQDTLAAGNDNGAGATVGLRASYPVYKNVSVTGSMERFVEFNGLNNQNGTVFGLGLVAKF